MLNKLLALIFFLFSLNLYAQDSFYQITVGSHFYNAISKSDTCSEAISHLGSIGVINSTYTFTSVNGVSCQMTSPLFGVSSISPLVSLVCPVDLPVYSHSEQKCVPEPTYCRDYGFDPINFVDNGEGFCPFAGTASCLRYEDQRIYSIPACTPKPTCNSLGFDSSIDYIGGFCTYNGTQFTSSTSYTDCKGTDEQIHPIPVCTLFVCADGNSIDTAYETCPEPKQCSDSAQTIVYGDSPCPSTPFVCADGQTVASPELCQDPTKQNKECSNGKLVPVDSDCPTESIVKCAGGTSYVQSVDLCPTNTNNLTTCSNGIQAQVASECPATTITNNNIKDHSSTTSTTTTTTTDLSGNSITSTSTTTNNTELHLDGVNSRLDKGNINTRETADNTKKIADILEDKSTGTSSSIYERSGKTVSGAMTAFYSDLKNTSLYVSVSSIFNLTPVGSSCPVWTIPAVMRFDAITFDFLCTQTMQDVFYVVRGVLLLVATLMAIRLMLG